MPNGNCDEVLAAVMRTQDMKAAHIKRKFMPCGKCGSNQQQIVAYDDERDRGEWKCRICKHAYAT